MKKLMIEFTVAEAVTCIIALDRLIHERGDQPHIIASAARTVFEAAIKGEPWPQDVDPALTLGDFA